MKSPRIRMLYFVPEGFPPYRVDVDVLFGRELIGRGHEIDLVASAESEHISPGAQDWYGRTAFVGPTRSGPGLRKGFARYGLAFWHDLRVLFSASTASYDAIQVRDKYLIAFVALIVARFRRVKFFYWLSFPEAESELQRAREGTARYPLLSRIRGLFFGWLLYKWILRFCDHAFVQSEQMRLDISQQGISASKMTAVPMGIAAKDIPTAKPEDSIPAPARETTTLVYLGTLDAQRRLEVLIDMMDLLRKDNIDVKLILVGDGQTPGDRLKLERYIDELQLRPFVEITGFLPRAEALQRVLEATICLSPFFPTPVLRSTSPTKLVEYLALGMPVVANDHPEQRRVLRESRAGICVPWGARHFARAVRWFVSCSDRRRREMGAQGQAWVKENRLYSQIADNVERTYLRLLDRRDL